MVLLLCLFEGSFQWRCSAVALNTSTLYIFNIIQPFLKETTYCSCDLTIWVFKKGVCLLIPGIYIYIYLCIYSINRENHGKSFALGAQFSKKNITKHKFIYSWTLGHLPPPYTSDEFSQNTMAQHQWHAVFICGDGPQAGVKQQPRLFFDASQVHNQTY